MLHFGSALRLTRYAVRCPQQQYNVLPVTTLVSMWHGPSTGYISWWGTVYNAHTRTWLTIWTYYTSLRLRLVFRDTGQATCSVVGTHHHLLALEIILSLRWTLSWTMFWMEGRFIKRRRTCWLCLSAYQWYRPLNFDIHQSVTSYVSHVTRQSCNMSVTSQPLG